MCIPIDVSDHTVVVTVFLTSQGTGCHGRSLGIPDDSVWGSGIPAEFKHWDDRQKVLLSVFSQLGVASKNTNRRINRPCDWDCEGSLTK